MICPDCRGRGFTPRMGAFDDDGPMHGPCETCGGSGIASCCDTAGAAEQRFVCAACGAMQLVNLMVCEECGEPLVFPVDAAA